MARLQQIRFKYDGFNIKLEVVYRIPETKQYVKSNVIAGCDLDVDNLATLGLSNGGDGLIINSKSVKSTNHQYNKDLAHKNSVLENHNKSSKAIKRFIIKKKQLIIYTKQTEKSLLIA